jgi:hypothetical protein
MLQLFVADFFFITPFLLNIFFLTIAYFKYNAATFLIKASSGDKKMVKSTISKKNYNYIFIKFMITLCFLLISQNYTYFGFYGCFWCNHLFLNNFIYKYIFFFLKIVLFIFYIVYLLAITKVYFSTDYLYSIGVILVISPLLFLSNNFFSFYFFLELIVCLTFFKFVVSRFWYKSSLKFYKQSAAEKYKDYTPKMFTNALFFQYWISFFSSIMLLYFFIALESTFSSTEWTFLNLASNFVKLPKSFYLYFYFFIIAFFLKLGITPFHLYKVEIYKGLPYISLFIYTIIFFFIYFFFFVFLIINYFQVFFSYYWISIVIVIIFGSLYVVCMLFDINFSKSFFAYSTIVNTLSFLLVLLAFF